LTISSVYVTGYAHDEAGNLVPEQWGLVYLGMVGHKTVLESIRATIQARQRKKLFLQSRPVYPLPTHYSQTCPERSEGPGRPKLPFYGRPARLWRVSCLSDC
jgi:hypothetical protein